MTDDDFIKRLLKEARLGYGFVPLIGSGLSAPSGIPVGAGFGNYIFNHLNKIVDGTRSWNPADPLWPPMNENADSARTFKDKQDAANNWLRDWSEKKSERGTALEAIGSLADWRSALTFLSRLPERRAKEPNKKHGQIFFDALALRAPDDTVVDSAFIHVTKDRQPTLAHMMLAHCADVLRIQTILTTNFDTLIEEAFLRQGVYLTTFDVHHDAGLPTGQLVLAQRSVVKLHGGRYGLRADYTLDEDPSQADQFAFASYFAARSVPDTSPNQDTDPDKKRGVWRNHLLVMGVSGADSRTMKLIRQAATWHSKLQIFWVFFDRLNEKAQEDKIQSLVTHLGVAPDRFHYTVQADVGLLLLHLYQRHYVSLPPPGADYTSHFVFPPDRYSDKDGRYYPGALCGEVERIKEKLMDAASASAPTKRQYPSLIAVRGQPGTSSAASQVYEELRGEYDAIWLELDLYLNTADFLTALYDAVVQKQGSVMVTPPISRIDPDACVQCLKNLIARACRPLLAFANGRDGPGSAARWDGKTWNGGERREFWKKAAELGRDNHALTLVVLAGNEDKRGLAMPAAGRRQWTEVDAQSCLNMSDDDIFASLKKDPPEKWKFERQRFVFALTLFRRSRYPAALTTWGLIKATKRLSTDEDNDKYRSDKCEEYIECLRKDGFVRRQPGGMIWMHADIRQSLYDRLRTINELKREQAPCHQGIADWYVKLFRSSNDPHAALESLYHRVQCARNATDQLLTEGLNPDEVQDFTDLRVTSIRESVETLGLARDRILAAARATATIHILSQLKDTIMRFRRAEPAFSAHRAEWEQLAVVCEDVLCDFARARGVECGAREVKAKRSRTPDLPVDRDLIMKRQDADGLLHNREYEQCEKAFDALFCALGVQQSTGSWLGWAKNGDNSKLVKNMRSAAKQWLENGKPEWTKQLAVRGLRGFMFLQMLIAQAEGWAAKAAKLSSKAVKSSSAVVPGYLRLRYAESIYTLATSVTRYVRDHDFLQVENTYLRTHYGVLVAELGRFKEAHRRLNEATGYLSQSSKAEDGLAWAVIEIRRAETYLYQSRQESDRGKSKKGARQKHLYRSAAAYLDDMRYALERAKTRFINQRKDRWWWSLLLELELEYFYEHCCQRPQVDPNAMPLGPREIRECAEVVKKGLLVASSDGIRLARMLELLTSINKKLVAPTDKTPFAEIVEEERSNLTESARKVSYLLQNLRVKSTWPSELKIYVKFVKKKFHAP